MIAFAFGVGETALEKTCVGQHRIDGAHDQPNLRDGLQGLEFGYPQFVLECCLSDEGNALAEQQFYGPKKGVVDVPVELSMVLRRCTCTERMDYSFFEFITTQSWTAYGTCQGMGQGCFS
jgi:hypothetical protein